MKASDRICVALDIDRLVDALALAENLKGKVGWLKINSLFTNYGPECIWKLKKASDANIFLDLKFHDIPDTVRRYIKAAAKHGVSMCNIHCSGGREMMEAAVAARDEFCPAYNVDMKVIGVTILTSLNNELLEEMYGVHEEIDVKFLVNNMFQMAYRANLDGIVCSPQELLYLNVHIRDFVNEQKFCNFMLVTPGIRPADSDVNDQKRIATPGYAVKEGATILVIGRPITGAKDPSVAVDNIVKEIEAAEANHE